MLLTLWNEFQEYEGNILAHIIATIPMIFAMRVKVSTFNTLSLTTIGLSSILINPPLHDEFILHEWYSIHKDEVKTLFETKAYKDPELLLPLPNEGDIKNIHDALISFGTQKTAWITGTAQLSFGQTHFWYTACSNCLKTVEADTDWIIKCSSCKEEAEVELRCRIGITLTDSTASIQCLISGKQAERLIQFTAAELKDAEAHGITMNQELSTIMKKHKLICFIKTYETTFQGLPQRRNAIIKAYTAAEVPNIPLPLQDSPTTLQASPSTTPSNTKQKQIADEQTFTPRAKLLLQEIAESTATKRSSMTESTATKRALTLTELEGHQIPAPTVGTEIHKTLEDTATSASPNATSIDKTAASPTKKPKQQEGN
ncbi:replication protein A 70 kDa DNA-binding subunit B-like [Coffea arabica]|uniref:Replication protein A 70 kDa DNA-binding subunit B-like n=1 Tax=Coffea arabica TaxID=13443 RepID=A0A6P6X507_COFAR|nr:replication protein A 70 kDa DNA-binding subunit B-like [Coffea arabica]